MNMIKISISALIVAFIIGLGASMATAQTIGGSKHDLGAGGTGQGTTTATTEVCVFCHTPHGSDAGVSAPLWNKVLPAAASYTRYSSLATATLDGEEADVGSVSLACLSCHDGSQAMDVVLNQPGPGGYNAAGAEIDLVAIGAMTGTPIPMLGTDLRNDHPVSIAYAGGACMNATALCQPSLGTIGDRDFRDAQHSPINGVDNFWVDTPGVGTAGQRDKTDMILYTRTFPSTDVGPAVECGSCHDPHNSTAQPVSFMRISNDNSDVCLACHIK